MTEGDFDDVIAQIADFVAGPDLGGDPAYATARLCLMDSIGCALLALNFPECTKLLGPIVPGASLRGGARVPGTEYELDPVQAAFNFGSMVRWLDYNDTWLAAEWGHPSDNLGGILMVADWLSRQKNPGQPSLTVRDVLSAMIKAHEIQGVLALENAFNRVGLDHVLLVRIATTAVVTKLLGGTWEQIANAVSHAWLDGGALRTYRHAPNTGSRKSWAAGDATSRAVRLALIARSGEMGYKTPLTTGTWGFQDALFRNQPIKLSRKLGDYVMEHVLFKVSFPAEFHGQTAVEAAIRLHPEVKDRLEQIQRIEIVTQESAVRIIDKKGPLRNPADRDHCIQYMVAIGLIHGELTAEHYEDAAASDPLIDKLRERMEVNENPAYTEGYLDLAKRSIANSVRVFFTDGEATERVEIEYPLGHRRRREESIPVLLRKFQQNVSTRLPEDTTQRLTELFTDASRLDAAPVHALVDATIDPNTWQRCSN